MAAPHVIANGREVTIVFPCTVEGFLVAHGLLPRSVVVEHNNEAVSPSEFARSEEHTSELQSH